MNLKQNSFRDHREISQDLELYLMDKKAGQGLPILLPN
jgi:threonyl-tRNA synthetase